MQPEKPDSPHRLLTSFRRKLRNVRAELKQAVEQAQDFSARYTENIALGLSCRTAVYDLPQIMNVRLCDMKPQFSVVKRKPQSHSLRGLFA